MKYFEISYFILTAKSSPVTGSSLNSPHSTLYTAHFTPHASPGPGPGPWPGTGPSLASVQFILHIEHSTLHNNTFILYDSHLSLHSKNTQNLPEWAYKFIWQNKPSFRQCGKLWNYFIELIGSPFLIIWVDPSINGQNRNPKFYPLWIITPIHGEPQEPIVLIRKWIFLLTQSISLFGNTMGNIFFDFWKYWIVILTFSFEISFQNHFSTLGSGQTENTQ